MFDLTYITFMAKTEPKDSYTIENCQWYTEYAVRTINKESERDELVKRFGVKELWTYSNPCAAIRRRVNIINNIEQCGDWDIIDFGDGVRDTAKKMGDSKYWNDAISLNDIHAEIVKKAKWINELQKELLELKNKITPHKFSRRSLLQEEYYEMFKNELKSRRLYTKYENGKLSSDISNPIVDKFNKQLSDELQLINNRITEIEQKIVELQE
jgi:hypothetical protein